MTDYYQLELDDMVIALNNKDVDIELLQKKLDIATKALKEYADKGNWRDCLSRNGDNEVLFDARFRENGFEPAQKVLKEIGLVDTSEEEEV